MPVLPTYESSNNINTPLGPERNQAAQPFKDNAQVLGTLQDITQKLSDAHDTMQETKAKTTAETSFLQTEQAALNDPNPDNLEMHLKNIQEAADNSVKGIDNQELAGQVKEDISHSAFLSGIKIQDLFKKKQMFANDQRLDQLATVTSQNKANAITAAQGQQDEDNFMSTIQQNVSKGLISPERGNQLVRQYKVGVVKTRIAQNPSTNPDDYKGVDEGVGLDLTESNEKDKMIQARIKQNEQTEIKQTLNDRVSVVKGIASGQYTWQNADQIGKIAAKDPKLGEALQAVFNADASGKPYEPEEEQNQSFADLAGKLFQSKTKEQVNDYILNVLNSHAERDMSKDRLAILISAAEQRANGLSTNKESGDGKDDPQQSVIGGAVKGIKDFFKGTEDNAKKAGGVLVDFFKNLSGGATPQVAHQEAMKTFNVKEYPWISALPKEGAIKVDKNGNKVRIFPDGHYEDAK